VISNLSKIERKPFNFHEFWSGELQSEKSKKKKEKRKKKKSFDLRML
jgi:hypothetical protein